MNSTLIRLWLILCVASLALNCQPDGTTSQVQALKNDMPLLAAASGFYNFYPPPPPKIGGVTHELIYGGSLGYYVSIAVDDQVHVAAEVNRAVALFHYGPQGLTQETVAPLGIPGDLKVDSEGHLHVVYWNGVNWRLFYATNADGAWRREDLGVQADFHKPSLALTADGRPRVAFTGRSDGVPYYAYRDAAAWHVEQVDTVGARASLSLLPDETPVIAYSADYGPLLVARRIGDVWAKEVACGGVKIIQMIGLVAEAENALHVAFAGAQPKALYYARYDGNAWQIETIDHAVDLPNDINLVQDTAGGLHFCFYDLYGDYRTHCVHGVSGDWTIEHVNAGEYPDLAIDGDDTLYLGQLHNSVFFAASDTGWEQVELSPAPPSTLLAFPDLAVDAEGAAHVSFSELGGTHLFYATDATGAWTTRTVGNGGADNVRSAIGVGAAGEVFIAYGQEGSGGLRLATYDGTWTYEDVDPTLNAGFDLDLATDGDGNPRIAYFVYNPAFNDLRYAARNGDTWDIEEVDTEGMVGNYPSLALAADGTPHITYYLQKDFWLGTLGYIRYAYRGPDGWEVETVRGSHMAGYNRLVLDSQDRPHLTCYNDGIGRHEYGWRTAAGWRVHPVDMDTNHMIAGLALDRADYPYLFTDAGGLDWSLRVSRLVNGAWQHGILDTYGEEMIAATDPAGGLRVVYTIDTELWVAKIHLNYQQ